MISVWDTAVPVTASFLIPPVYKYSRKNGIVFRSISLISIVSKDESSVG
jgi:hypothetical protein